MKAAFRRSTLPLLTLSAFLSACSDEVVPGAGLTGVAAVPDGAVQTVIHQGSGPEEGTLAYTVRILTKDKSFAAYQGVLVFTPGSMEVIRATVPTGLDGESHLVNIADAANGRVRFAAYAPERFGSDEAFTLIVRPTKSLADANLIASLEVAGQAEGKVYAPSSLRQSVGVMDRTGRQLVAPR